MSLRILHLAAGKPIPDSGAAGTNVQGVLALRRIGHTVFDFWEDSLPRRIRHFNLHYALELPFAYRELVSKFVRKQRVDVVQISQPHGYLAAMYLRRYYPDTVFVHRSHGLEGRATETAKYWESVYPQPRPFYRRVASSFMGAALEHNNRMIAKYAHGHLVGASECGDFLRTRYNVAEARIEVLPQGIVAPFLAGATEITPNRLKKLLYVGQFAFIKGPMILAHAVSVALRADPALSFTWVCSKVHHSDALNMIDSGVRDRVTMLDWMPQPELVDIYDRHGMFIFPSFFEGFGKAFTEAMSRGLIVIASDTGGMKDIICDRSNGLKAPPGDAVSIAARVAEVIANPGLASAISRRAIEDVSVLTWDEFARKSELFYRKLMSRSEG